MQQMEDGLISPNNQHTQNLSFFEINLCVSLELLSPWHMFNSSGENVCDIVNLSILKQKTQECLEYSIGIAVSLERKIEKLC